MIDVPLLHVEGLEKRFSAHAEPVFSQVSFSISRSEIVCMIGHSGCGKSTLLRILAGLEAPTVGRAIMKEQKIDRPSLDRGVVFQGHALLPWLTAQDNVALAVRARHPTMSKRAVQERSSNLLDMVHLKSGRNQRPAALSGGMRQRVGIARAFAAAPELLLMDEPFGALDALTRSLIQDELRELCMQTRQTVFMITHDVDEAILLADRIFLMGSGPNAQIVDQIMNPLPRERCGKRIREDTDAHILRERLLTFLLEQ